MNTSHPPSEQNIENSVIFGRKDEDGVFARVSAFLNTYRIGDEMGLDVAGLHTAEEMAEDRFRAYWLGSERLIPDKGDLSDYWVAISSGRDFFRGAPSYTYIRDPIRRLCH
ncbi:hypothetical protein Tco_0225546, partial [Tanacetum coccineum]